MSKRQCSNVRVSRPRAPATNLLGFVSVWLIVVFRPAGNAIVFELLKMRIEEASGLVHK